MRWKESKAILQLSFLTLTAEQLAQGFMRLSFSHLMATIRLSMCVKYRSLNRARHLEVGDRTPGDRVTYPDDDPPARP